MEIFTLLGFFSGYSVIIKFKTNTSWISSNKSVKWYYQWIRSVILGVIFYGHFTGDVSYGRLERIPFETVQWYHVPLSLVLLTRIGIPFLLHS